MNLLKNMVIIITGGTRGIGLATARKCVEEGAIVYSCARNEMELQDNIRYLHLDVTNYQECLYVAKKVISEQGKIDGLVADAGITRDALIKNLSEDMFNQVINTNVKGVFNIIKAVQPYMDEKQFGSIVTLGSIVGEYGNIGQINYAASKAAVIGLTKSCAKEFSRKGQNIRVNAICPGYIMTDMLRSVPQNLLDEYVNRTMLKRLGKPEEIASIITFLLSSDSSYMTGSVIDANGGLY